MWGVGVGWIVKSFFFHRKEMKRNEAFTAVVKTGRGGKTFSFVKTSAVHIGRWELAVGRWEVGGSGASDETKGGRGNLLGFGEGPETRARCRCQTTPRPSLAALTPRIAQN